MATAEQSGGIAVDNWWRTDSMYAFRISGRVIEPKPQRGLAGLRVAAWDNDLLVDDLVGSAVMGAEGAVEIAFAPSSFRELFLDRRPNLYFKISHDGV